MTVPGSSASQIAQWFRRQAQACTDLGSPLYAGLLDHAADDLLAGGPTRAVLEQHLAEHGSAALELRLLGGAHALVLTGQAQELARFYPSAGGTADPGPNADLAWPALRRVLASQGEQLRAWLDHPPQTNEVGRGAALVGALCLLAAQRDYPIRLYEIGASAGLNLRADQFRVTGAGGGYGPPSSPVQLIDGWLGSPPPVVPLNVIERVGGDLAPVDPVGDAGRLHLCAYVWADQIDRLRRLRRACDLAAQTPAQLRTESAQQTVTALRPEPGTWTVLWHSIMRHYLDQPQNAALDAAIAELGAAATGSAPVAHVSLELIRGTAETPVKLTIWPGGQTRQLGTAPPHGIPVTWSADFR